MAGLEVRLASVAWVDLVQPLKQKLQEQPDVSTGREAKSRGSSSSFRLCSQLFSFQTC